MLIILEFGHIYKAMKNYLKILLLLILAGCKQGDLEFTQGGKEFSINYDNEIVVLNVWADWCPPCIKEFPYFNKLNELIQFIKIGKLFYTGWAPVCPNI